MWKIVTFSRPSYHSYGYQGYQVFVNTLEAIFINNPTAPNHLNLQKSAPLSPDTYLRHVLIPELASCLIAQDIKMDRTDPQVKETLESSREYGATVFPILEETLETVQTSHKLRSQRMLESSRDEKSVQKNEIDLIDQTATRPATVTKTKPKIETATVTKTKAKIKTFKSSERQLLDQLPRIIVSYVKSVFDPPAFGNCGFYAIAHALRCYKQKSYVLVRKHLLKELKTYRKVHEHLILTVPGMKSHRNPTRRPSPAVTEIVDDLMV